MKQPFFARGILGGWFRVYGYGLSYTRDPRWAVRSGERESWRLGPWWICLLTPSDGSRHR